MTKILDSSNLKEFADDIFIFDEMAKRSTKKLKTLSEKEKVLVTSDFSFSHSVFKRLVLQTHKNQGSLGKGFNPNSG